MTQSNLRLVHGTDEPPSQTVAGAPCPGKVPALLGRARLAPVGFRWYLPLKHFMDFVGALFLLPLAVPIIVLSALVIKLTSRGPAFYKQWRVGQYGRPFTIFKIRTMIHNCESLTGPRWSIPGDPRVTPFGWFLRVTRLDKLPQLWNVLRGDMSLIGPRPERPEFLPELESAMPNYRQRLAVRPGVTGLAQIQLPPDSDLNSVQRKLAFDLYYVCHLNLWVDLRLLLATGLFAMGIPFRWSSRLLNLPEPKIVKSALTGTAELTRPEPTRQRLSA